MSNKLSTLLSRLEALEAAMLSTEETWRERIASLPPKQQTSAANLLHYLCMRKEDLRLLQDELHDAGLSSLASSESHTLAQIQAVMARLGRSTPEDRTAACDFSRGGRLLNRRSMKLFGERRREGIPHIMVTLDASVGEDQDYLEKLLLAGMDIARINCAHDDEDTWLEMIENVRRVSRKSALPCKIYMDLAGPKIRTIILGKGKKKGRAKLKEGQTLLLVEQNADYDKDETVIGCTLPGVVADLRVDDRVLFDDGLIETQVEHVEADKARLRLLRVSSNKSRLKAEKGINFPDTDLSVNSLTEEDRGVLPFIARHADLVGFSFVRHPEELAELQELLKKNPDRQPNIILKIETYEAVRNLPALLLQGMREKVFGVMIARGDLAVEIGFERLSEIQEEILWICEAAHAPVIWATQVLESLNKKGVPTRAELTDAAHAALAECVMLNKGDYLLRGMTTLQNILHRSGGHRLKKRFIFRPLSIAHDFLEKSPTLSSSDDFSSSDE